MDDVEYEARVALGTLLAVPSVHHPDQCDCSDDEWCEGLVDQVDAVIDAGWLPQAARVEGPLDSPVETQYWRQTRKCDGSTGLWSEWRDEFDIDTELLAHERENVRLMNRALNWSEFRVVRKTSRITELP